MPTFSSRPHYISCSILHILLVRHPKWVQNLLQKGAAESHVDPDPQGAAESRVEPDLSGQGTAESRRAFEPAPVLTDESNGVSLFHSV